MKKGLFIYGNEYLISKKNVNGIDKKVFNQIIALNNYSIECKQYCFPIEKNNLLHKIKIRLPFINSGPIWHYNDKFKDLDFLYFRRTEFFSIYCILMLKRIKRNNPNVKIVVEIPTYPYDLEISSSLIDFPFLLKDRFNRRFLHKYVDRIVTVEDSTKIFGIETIKMINGIKVDSIIPIEHLKNSNAINLIMVAMFAEWHGVDRLLYGIIDYYNNGGKRNFVLHLVGSGSQNVINKYKTIVTNNSIEKHVIFYGNLYDRQLDEVYNISDIAISSIGTHRKNIFVLSDLKSREYLAKGLPIIGSCKIDVLDNNYPYYLRFPTDNTHIDLKQVELFYEDIYCKETHKEVAAKIRNFAINHIDISTTMNSVISYILK
jgi:hypothetical protein